MSDVPGAIVITPAQMYADMQKDLGAIRAAQDELKITLSGVPAMLMDHEQRIRTLEQAKWFIAGICGAAGTAVGAIAMKFLGA